MIVYGKPLKTHVQQRIESGSFESKGDRFMGEKVYNNIEKKYRLYCKIHI